MKTKRDLFHEVTTTAAWVRTALAWEADELLEHIEDSLREWFREKELPLQVIAANFDAEAEGQVVVELDSNCGDEDEAEYLSALQDLLAGHVEVRKWEPELVGHDFELAGLDEWPMGLKHRAIKSSSPLTADSLHAALALSVHGYGPPKKGSKGKPARW